MPIADTVRKVLALADSVNEFLPASGLTQAGIDLATKMTDVIDSIGQDIPLDRQAEAKATRAALAAKVTAKAAATSKRLRGEEE